MTFALSSAATMRGEWWLPDHPEAAVPSVLHCDPVQGLTLEIDLPKGRTLAQSLLERALRDVVHGRTTDGSPVTVFGCMPHVGLPAEITLSASAGSVPIGGVYSTRTLRWTEPEIGRVVQARNRLSHPGAIKGLTTQIRLSSSI